MGPKNSANSSKQNGATISFPNCPTGPKSKALGGTIIASCDGVTGLWGETWATVCGNLFLVRITFTSAYIIALAFLALLSSDWPEPTEEFTVFFEGLAAFS